MVHPSKTPAESQFCANDESYNFAAAVETGDEARCEGI